MSPTRLTILSCKHVNFVLSVQNDSITLLLTIKAAQAAASNKSKAFYNRVNSTNRTAQQDIKMHLKIWLGINLQSSAFFKFRRIGR